MIPTSGGGSSTGVGKEPVQGHIACRGRARPQTSHLTTFRSLKKTTSFKIEIWAVCRTFATGLIAVLSKALSTSICFSSLFCMTVLCPGLTSSFIIQIFVQSLPSPAKQDPLKQWQLPSFPRVYGRGWEGGEQTSKQINQYCHYTD